TSPVLPTSPSRPAPGSTCAGGRRTSGARGRSGSSCRPWAPRPRPPGKCRGRLPAGAAAADNRAVPALEPADVIEAVAADPRLRVFTRHGRIETMPAKRSRRLLLLDLIAQAFEPGVRYP